jgi:predicted esterase
MRRVWPSPVSARPGLAALAALLLAAAGLVPAAHAAPAPAAARVTAVALRLPHAAPAGQPLPVLLALHGLGDSGEGFAAGLAAQADRRGWLLVAPTIAYGEWRDPAQLAREEAALIRWLDAYLDALPARLGRPVQGRVLVFGHSRGAQLAHRLALARPERVAAVAALSAGTYTLPLAEVAGRAARFPFGAADLAAHTGRALDAAALRGVRFLVGVGAEDADPAAVPRQWDAYVGATRLERARAFAAALRGQGVPATWRAFAGAGHDLTPAMVEAAAAWLAAPGRGPRRAARGGCAGRILAAQALAT